ncbi:CRISPR-associated endonuclease Cas2 [Sulfuricystis multivorans]|uniref:CRISPR-associated endonuclease Cas2 n=1 Tax=Sulfuricystis multivorans TaxID=2211108 RepID=UPI000F836183|nr:CRISPR-associated endonuclease Cas2 [Sulfuricystis multivorans]
MDTQRHLTIVAYDIADERRLHRVCRYLTGYKVAGQKSVFEIWVTPAQLAAIRAELEAMIDLDADRVHFLGLDPRMKPRLFGRAKHFTDGFFAIV